MKLISVKYLFHGNINTGGSRHERHLCKEITERLSREGVTISYVEENLGLSFRGVKNLFLLGKSFSKSTADINIVKTRSGLPSILNNLFTKRKTIVVIHHLPPEKSGFFSVYLSLLFYIVRNFSSENSRLICVSDYWKKILEKKAGRETVILFPNLFDNHYYQQFITAEKKKKIYLGQYSEKIHPELIPLGKKLTEAGYECYFTSPIPHGKQNSFKDNPFPVKHLPFHEYLTEMAESMYTLAMPCMEEGWNRIAHESTLVGTPVIGLDKGGLGDLLKESGNLIVTSPVDGLGMILNKRKPVKTNASFSEKYDVRNSDYFMKDLYSFITK